MFRLAFVFCCLMPLRLVLAQAPAPDPPAVQTRTIERKVFEMRIGPDGKQQMVEVPVFSTEQFIPNSTGKQNTNSGFSNNSFGNNGDAPSGNVPVKMPATPPPLLKLESFTERLPNGEFQAATRAVPVGNGQTLPPGEFSQQFPGDGLKVLWTPGVDANGRPTWLRHDIRSKAAPNSSGRQNLNSGFSNNSFGSSGTGTRTETFSVRLPNGQIEERTREVPNTSGDQNFNAGFSNNSFNNNRNMRPEPQPESDLPNSSGSRNFSSGFNNNSFGNGNSLSDPPRKPEPANSMIRIEVPSWCQGRCSYQLINNSRGYDYTISGGGVQEFPETTQWTIRYNEGTTGGFKTYRLRGGKTYELQSVNGFWSLYMRD